MNVSSGRRPAALAKTSGAAAVRRILETYAGLAERGEHLLQRLLDGQPPRQWQHYPEEDAIDLRSAYQWFYHSHSPEDRPGSVEHGHFHLFARRPLWSRRLHSRTEQAFARLTGQPQRTVQTRHLLSIGLDAKGVPVSLFTVNSWVTGDLMLNAVLTEQLLARIQLNTGHPDIERMLTNLIRLCLPQIRLLLVARDAALASCQPGTVLTDQTLEVLSHLPIDLDRQFLAG
nr:hypothetical protein [Undibacterium oligocarboniphilum]